jgi:hypothetical protein
MWRFILPLLLVGLAQAGDVPPVVKVEAPKPESTATRSAQVWDDEAGIFVSLADFLKQARARVVLDQVPSPRVRAMQVDGIKVLEQRFSDLRQYRINLIQQEEAALIARYRGL